MIKIGVADYGLNCWYGALYDYADRFEMLKSLGFDGLERLEAKTESEVINISADAKRYGLDFATCRGACAMETLRWTAALGKKYVWTESKATNLDEFCKQVNEQIKVSAKYGVNVAIHNHLGSVVETQEQLEKFLENCPDAGLILDVGHLDAADGDVLATIDKYFDRIQLVHLKDYVYKNKEAKNWWDRLRFCELGAGEMGDLNKKIIAKLLEKKYEGWICIEHDTHLQDPSIDLKKSIDFVHSCGV